MTDAQEAHTESAWASVASLWRQRCRVLQSGVSRARLAGIETRLLADLWRLSQTTAPELADAEQPLLALAVRVLGKTEPDALAAEWLALGHEELDADWRSIIGLMGADVWHPVLAELTNHPDCPEPLLWQLLGSRPALASPANQFPLPNHFTDHSPIPGQVSYALHHNLWQPAEIAADWPLDDNDDVWERDLTALLLALSQVQPEQARAIVARQLAKSPSRPFWLHWSAALALPEATTALQQAFTEGFIDAASLALHGQFEHLEFSITLLDQPRTNTLGAALWSALTAETLPRVARLSVVGEVPAAADDTDTLADVDAAQSRL
ncbi:MAG TPA: hypothetical protein VFN16_05720, partial [Saccharospirillum sp.]|nr:hypothetical protein [Saccharospirillum sp.]